MRTSSIFLGEEDRRLSEDFFLHPKLLVLLAETSKLGPPIRAQRFRGPRGFSPLQPVADSSFCQIEFPGYGTHRAPALADQLHGFRLELVREFPSMSPSHFGLPPGGYFLRRGVYYEGTGSTARFRSHGPTAADGSMRRIRSEQLSRLGTARVPETGHAARG